MPVFFLFVLLLFVAVSFYPMSIETKSTPVDIANKENCKRTEITAFFGAVKHIDNITCGDEPVPTLTIKTEK